MADDADYGHADTPMNAASWQVAGGKWKWQWWAIRPRDRRHADMDADAGAGVIYLVHPHVHLLVHLWELWRALSPLVGDGYEIQWGLIRAEWTFKAIGSFRCCSPCTSNCSDQSPFAIRYSLNLTILALIPRD